MAKQTRILFMGTPEIASYILEGLIQNGYNIIGVVAQMDKPVGRKGIIEPVPTKKVAIKYNIPVYQPQKIRLSYQFVEEIKPDLIVTCAYGQIVPQGLLDIPRLGSINVHGSLLPKYRGASPIQQSLINNDSVSGVTIMEMIDKMDAGCMYYKKEIPLLEDDNFTSLYDKMKVAGLEALLEMLPDFVEGKIKGELIAMMQDRICCTLGKPQVYGTQGNYDDNGVFVPVAIEDSVNVDVRRAALGMMPLSDYIKEMSRK